MTNQESGFRGGLKRWAHKFDPTITDPRKRFWARVVARSKSECWPWKGGPMTKGYPTVRIKAKTHNAHHAAWVFEHGPVPSGKVVCHSCDNRICCNPNHLFLGSNFENTQDALQKGRMARGEKGGTSKLTNEKVSQIRLLYAKGGIGHRGLARRFRVCKSNITAILNRLTWTHIN